MRLTKRNYYVFEKRGWYYFSRRVPSDLSDHYQTDRIVVALRTKVRRSAETRDDVLAFDPYVIDIANKAISPSG